MCRCLTKQKYQKDATNCAAHFFRAHEDAGQKPLQIAPAPLQFLSNHAEE